MDSTVEIPASPDWAKLELEILCPLCDYNLRGLVEPRCPECGHQFVWSEVVEQGDRVHPYLFEHQPHRNVWSIFKTLIGSLWPPRFWRTLLPMHTPVVRRILIYWLILFVPGFLAMLPPLIWTTAQFANSFSQMRVRQVAFINANPTDRVTAALLKKFGSAQAVVDAENPMPGTVELGVRVLRNEFLHTRWIVPWIGGAALWPCVTMASLLLFRASIAQSRIKTAHVLRCVIYSQDVLLVMLPLAVCGAWVVGNDAFRYAAVPYWVTLAALLVLTWRLAVAYHLYLRFPHAIATVLASQVIVALALFKLYLVWLGF